MDLWTTIWTVVFAATIFVYAGLVLVVTLGGWKDIRAMFEHLESNSDAEE